MAEGSRTEGSGGAWEGCGRGLGVSMYHILYIAVGFQCVCFEVERSLEVFVKSVFWMKKSTDELEELM